MSIVVTSGKKYIDIDGYASVIAYTKLLNSLGKRAFAINDSIINESIPSIITSLKYHLDSYEINDQDQFIILDVSNPLFFPDFINPNQIIEIIDHHTGNEEYWKDKKGVQIEFIGSVCTIIFEKFVAYNMMSLLDQDMCKLLIAGILDNTLNLKASVTTSRDIEAYKQLMMIGRLDNNWAKEYFNACEQEILVDLEKSLRNDLKIEESSPLLPNVFGQLVVLDVKPIFDQLESTKKLIKEYGNEWMLNLICLSDGKSYIIADNEETKRKLEQLFNSNFNGDILILNHFMLRKEIKKKAQEKTS